MTTQESDLAFLEKKNANALSAKDIVITIIRNIHWILLSALIGGLIAYYISDKADRIYESHARIKINSVTRNRLDNGASMLENITNRRVAISMNAINDEIIVLRSETPMLEVAKRLNLGMQYKYKTKLVKREKDLYKESPVDVKLLDVQETEYATLAITVAEDSSFVVEIDDYEPVKGHLGDTVASAFGRVVVRPTWALRDLYYDAPIMVLHKSIVDAADAYRAKLIVERNSQTDGIINLSLKDTNTLRAADILNEMIAVYNDNTIQEKKDIIQITSDYINTRISQLDSELGAKESQIARFKSENQVLNLQDYGQSYLTASIESSEEVERLQAQISHAQYLRQFTAPGSENRLFPRKRRSHW